jgi:general secretion pathway protein K
MKRAGGLHRSEGSKKELLFLKKKKQKDFWTCGRWRAYRLSTRERGFALLVVLWSAVFLAFLMTQILASSRTAMTLAGNLRAASEARAADDGGIYEGIFHALAPGNAHWAEDDAPHLIAVGGIVVTIRVKTLDGLVNPNTASAALLTGLLRAVGEPGNAATEIARNIIAWRNPAASDQAAAALLESYRAAGMAYGPPAAQFSDIGQLADVMGMTPALLALLKPHMSLFQPGDPEPEAADAVVRQAIAYANVLDPTGSGYEGAPTIAVSACATGPAPLCRNATISLPGLQSLTPYQIESLQDGP